MSLSELYFMEAAVLGLMIFTEIYSSAWADLLGRKKIIVIGAFLNLLAIIIFSFANSPLHIWLSNIFIMVGFSLISGTDRAMLADYLSERGEGDRYLEIISIIKSRGFFVATFTSIISGYLYAISPRLPMFLSIPGVLFSFVIVFLLIETKRRDRATHKENFDLIKISSLFLANHKKLKWIIGFYILAAVSTKIWFFTFNPYFELVELSPEYYGWIFAVLNLTAWFFTKNTHKLKTKIGEHGVLVSLVLAMSLPLIFMGFFVSKVSLSMIIFNNYVRGVSEPFMSDMKNKYLSPENRATVLSLASSLKSVFGMISLFVFGLVLKIFSLGESILGLGFLMLFIGIVFLKKYKKVFI